MNAPIALEPIIGILIVFGLIVVIAGLVFLWFLIDHVRDPSWQDQPGKCQECRKEIAAGAALCPYCGTRSPNVPYRYRSPQ